MGAAALAFVAAVVARNEARSAIEKLAWVKDARPAVGRLDGIMNVRRADDEDGPPIWQASWSYTLDGHVTTGQGIVNSDDKALLERAGVVPLLVDRSGRSVAYLAALDVR